MKTTILAIIIGACTFLAPLSALASQYKINPDEYSLFTQEVKERIQQILGSVEKTPKNIASTSVRSVIQGYIRGFYAKHTKPYDYDGVGSCLLAANYPFKEQVRFYIEETITNGLLRGQSTRYKIDFARQTAERLLRDSVIIAMQNWYNFGPGSTDYHNPKRPVPYNYLPVESQCYWFLRERELKSR